MRRLETGSMTNIYKRGSNIRCHDNFICLNNCYLFNLSEKSQWIHDLFIYLCISKYLTHVLKSLLAFTESTFLNGRIILKLNKYVASKWLRKSNFSSFQCWFFMKYAWGTKSAAADMHTLSICWLKSKQNDSTKNDQNHEENFPLEKLI